MAAPVANIIGITYVDIASTRMANLQATMDTVLAAQAAVLHPILRGLFIIYIGRQFLLILSGDLVMRQFFGTIIRAGVIILLVTHSGQFTHYVRDPLFTKLPQALAAMVGGRYTGATSTQPLAAQFDSAAAKGDSVTSEIDAVSTSILAPADWINSASAHTANGVFQSLLAAIVGIWMLGQTLLAIVLSFGPDILCLELFERTRGFVDQWIGKLVGAAAFGFATSFVLAMQINEMQTMFDKVRGHAALNAAEAAGMFWHVVSNGVIDVITIAVLPTAVGFGSGAVVGLAAPSMMIAMRSLTLASSAVTIAAGKTANAISRSARK